MFKHRINYLNFVYFVFQSFRLRSGYGVKLANMAVRMYPLILSDGCLEVDLPRKALKHSITSMLGLVDGNINKPRYGNRLPKLLTELTLTEMAVLSYIHETILELIRLSGMNEPAALHQLGHVSHNLQFILMKSDEYKSIDEGQPLFLLMKYLPLFSEKYVELAAEIRGMTKLRLIYEANENLDMAD